MPRVSAAERAERNAPVIEEYRKNNGVLTGGYAGAAVLLLHHVGARTGTKRVNPLAYQEVGDTWAIFASAAGATNDPDWFHNLMAHPRTTIELGAESFEVTAREVTGEERSVIWEEQKRRAPGFADYEAATEREIPVVILERVAS
jgi:deazaflavin-dependent oxidoreductase (nitroreductase family)